MSYILIVNLILFLKWRNLLSEQRNPGLLSLLCEFKFRGAFCYFLARQKVGYNLLKIKYYKFKV